LAGLKGSTARKSCAFEFVLIPSGDDRVVFTDAMAGLSRTPEVTELRSFCAAADLGSIGRAAIRLNVSQPALTKRLQALEALAGVALLERSPRGVTLTPAGRRLYTEARRLLEQAEIIEGLMLGLARTAGPLRIAASHSAAEAIVTDALASDHGIDPIELLTANSHVVRSLVAEGRVELGIAAGRPGATPNPAVRELPLAEDCVVCAVPGGHPWAQRRRITRAEFLRTPMVMRDPGSNARWTVDSVLNREGLRAAAPLVECPTPVRARQEALARNAPLILSRHVLPTAFFVEVEVERLEFRRSYQLVLPAIGEPSDAVKALIARLAAVVARW
jgi:DNA-binding transcriptional LysR family regulator